jgi:hypothetical protein
MGEQEAYYYNDNFFIEKTGMFCQYKWHAIVILLNLLGSVEQGT